MRRQVRRAIRSFIPMLRYLPLRSKLLLMMMMLWSAKPRTGSSIDRVCAAGEGSEGDNNGSGCHSEGEAAALRPSPSSCWHGRR